MSHRGPRAGLITGGLLLIAVAGCDGLPCDPIKLDRGWEDLADPGDPEAALRVIEGACEPTFTAAARRWVDRGLAPETSTELGVAIHAAWADLCPDGPDLVAATSAPILETRRRTVQACGETALGVSTADGYIHASGSPELAALVSSWLTGRRKDTARIDALARSLRGAPVVLLPPGTELVRWGPDAPAAPARVELVLTPTGLYLGDQVLMVLDDGAVPPGFRAAGKGRLRGPFAPDDDPLADWALRELRSLDEVPDPLVLALDGRVPMATVWRVAASLGRPGAELLLVGLGTRDGVDDRLATRAVRLPTAVPRPPADGEGPQKLTERQPAADLTGALAWGGPTAVTPELAFPAGLPCSSPPEGMACVPAGTEDGAWHGSFYIDRDPRERAADGDCPGDYCAEDEDEVFGQWCASRGKRPASAAERARAAAQPRTGGDGQHLDDGLPRCASSLPELNTHPAPALTEIRLPLQPVPPPDPADLARFRRTPDEALESPPICALDGNGVRRTWTCREPWTYAPAAGLGEARLVPYLENSGGGYVGFGGMEEWTLAARARSTWAWLITDDPARAALYRVQGALIAASPTADGLVARLAPEALEDSLALVTEIPADAGEIHRPADVLAAMRGELWAAYSSALAAAVEGAGGEPDPGVAWLTDGDDYAHLHRLWSQGRARVVVADAAGDGWTDVGNAAHDLGTPIRVLHLGATAYAWGGTLTGAFRDAVAALPLDSRAVVLQRLERRPVPAGGTGAWQYHVHGGRDYQRRIADPAVETVGDVAARSGLTDDPRLFIAGVPGR